MRVLSLIMLVLSQLAARAVTRAWPGLARAMTLWKRLGQVGAVLEAPRLLYSWQAQPHVPVAWLWLGDALAGGVVMGSLAWLALACPVLLWQRWRAPPAPVDPARRAALSWATQVPVAAIGLASPLGVASAEVPPELTPVEIALPDLPEALIGLKILQVSDVHLGGGLGLSWLTDALARAAPSRPDLIAVTGDLSDDLSLMEPAFLAIAALKPPLGVWAVPGNHEHLVGIERYAAAAAAAGVPLITGATRKLTHQGADFTLLGIDYPITDRSRGETRGGRLYEMVGAVHAQAPEGLRILLSHHPDAFDAAAPRGIALTLAGHTHGGQIALFGVSLLTPLLRYPMGLYERGASRLWVTRGLGHWLPFRLGCPTELPLLVLKRR